MKSSPKNWSSVRSNSSTVVTRYTTFDSRGKMLSTTRDDLIRSGSVVSTTRPSGPSSIGSHAAACAYSRLICFSRSSGFGRSGLNGSYGTSKKVDSARPISRRSTWKSSCRISSTSTPLRRADVPASLISSAEMRPSATSASYFERTGRDTRCASSASLRRLRIATASASQSSRKPSISAGPNGCPDRLLISCATPSSSDGWPRLPWWTIGAASTCRGESPASMPNAFDGARPGWIADSSRSSCASLTLTTICWLTTTPTTLVPFTGRRKSLTVPSAARSFECSSRPSSLST